MRLNEKLHYHAYSSWDKRTGGIADTGNFAIPFDTPEEYEGNETAPCPDQLFLASLSGCLMNTFLYYKNQLGAETQDISVNADAEITLKSPYGYRMTGIEFKILIQSDEDNLELNQTCAERARDYCHLTKSIETAIPTRITIEIKQT